MNFLKNKRAMANAAGIGGIIIAVVIGLSIAAAILPDAIVDITNTTSYTGAPAAVLAIVPVLGIIVVAGLALMFYKKLAT